MAAEGHGLAGVCVRTRMKEACFSLAGYVEVDGVELDEALANLYVAHINLVLCVGNVLVFVLSLITSNSYWRSYCELHCCRSNGVYDMPPLYMRLEAELEALFASEDRTGREGVLPNAFAVMAELSLAREVMLTNKEPCGHAVVTGYLHAPDGKVEYKSVGCVIRNSLQLHDRINQG